MALELAKNSVGTVTCLWLFSKPISLSTG
uniref:Uncharacterized protein n=1 Tax=Anguilla anguilla TaxID=7936 RepID=A0A0E9PYH4_ANGAN